MITDYNSRQFNLRGSVRDSTYVLEAEPGKLYS